MMFYFLLNTLYKAVDKGFRCFAGRLTKSQPLCITNKKGKDFHLSLLLPDMDSNHDILNQNQLYYPYTIGQSLHILVEWAAKIGVGGNCSKFFRSLEAIINN